MPDAFQLVKLIKRAALEAVEAGKPVQICFGKVTEPAPLKILVEQKLLLGEAQLVLTRNVTDYEVDLSVSHTVEAWEGYSGFPSHSHKYKGKKKYTVHNALQQGDLVVLLRQQGGQKYIVLDRVASNPKLEGEWIL